MELPENIKNTIKFVLSAEARREDGYIGMSDLEVTELQSEESVALDFLNKLADDINENPEKYVDWFPEYKSSFAVLFAAGIGACMASS